MDKVIDPEIGKKRELLFDFWKNIPIICNMKASCYKVAFQEVRSTILDILREGIRDEFPSGTGIHKRRHALSAQECQKYVSERLERKVKLSNIYFHLKRLDEIGLIKEITTIRGKKHSIAYYGRTAQLFHFGGSDSDDKTEAEDKIRLVITSIFKSLNPTLKEAQISELFETLYSHQKQRKNARDEWMANHSELLNSLEFDILDIDKFLVYLEMSTPDGLELATQFHKLLKFPQN
jgi:hypothetical protein